MAKQRKRKIKGHAIKTAPVTVQTLLRNRAERRRAEVYRLEPLLDRDDPDLLAIHAPEHHVEGSFGQYVVVSVPESCNMARAEEIKAQVAAIVKRPVVVMSHNISLLKAVKLTSSEAAECIRKGEEYAAAMQQRVAEIVTEVPSDGDRPGLCASGDGGDRAAGSEGSPAAGVDEGAGDGQGAKEGDA